MKIRLLIFFSIISQYIYSQTEDSWTLVQAGEDIYNGQIGFEDWPNRWDIESLDMKPVSGGFLTCGYYNDQTFDSTDGNTFDLTNKYGAYLVKYDLDGVLQWLVRTNKASDEERNVIMSIATDSDNNIYIIGHSDGIFYDASGDSQAVAPQWPSGGSSPFLIKLDENGNFLWKMITSGFYPRRVSVDHDNNVVVCGTFMEFNNPYMFFNDQYVGTFTNITDDNVNYYIAKYTSDGEPLWDAGVHIDSVNEEFIEGITFDEANNIYINGTYEMNLKVYDEDEDVYIEREWSGNYGGSMFIAKYTPDGDAQWIVNSDDSKLSKIITNPDGTHFITGTNTVYNGQGSHVMTNSDGSVTTQNTFGPFYFAKINADGDWDWLTGTVGTTYGHAFEMTKHEDEISIAGYLNNWGETSASGIFFGTDGTYSDITIDVADIFIVTFSTEGSLLRLSKSGVNGSDFAPQLTSGFFKDNDGNFYIQRNLWFYTGSEPQEFYGQMIAPLIGTDAAITKFREEDGIQIYPVLATGNNALTQMSISPNPTQGKFTVALGNSFNKVTLSVIDSAGRIVSYKTFNNSDDVNAEINGAAGVYMAKIETDEQVQWFKIVKR